MNGSATGDAHYDLVVIGFGSAGMVGAEFAARLGLRVAVVERDRAGGDCLWTGCVPSKALLASARAAHTIRHGDDYGLPASPTLEIDTGRVFDRIRRVQSEIAAGEDDPVRFERLGVEVVVGTAEITGPHEVTVDGTRRIEADFVLVATGSSPAVPPVEGLADAGYLTSNTFFALERAPTRLAIIGGGPIAVEMAQGLARLGVAVSVIEMMPTLLSREEPELVALLTERLEAEGVDVHTGVVAESVTRGPEGSRRVIARAVDGGADSVDRVDIVADEILVAVGRASAATGVGLEAVGVEMDERGHPVIDDRMRTSVPSIYIVGDAAGRELFTHAAGYQAVRAVRDMFFPGRGRAGAAIPWVTFTDPELAHAGLTSAEARDEHGDDVGVWRRDLTSVDRAVADGAAVGRIVLVTVKNKIVGGHVLSPAAGELINEIQLAINTGIKVTTFAARVRTYPTYSTGVGQTAGEAGYEALGRLRWLTRLRRPRRR